VPTDSPFHDITGNDGTFFIRDLPLGTYTVEAWDADLGALSQEVKLVPAPGYPLIRFAFGKGKVDPGNGGVIANDGPCRIATAGRGPVGEACAGGGIRSAMRFMKDVVKQLRAKGLKHTCDECHLDLDGYALNNGARGRLDELLTQLQERQEEKQEDKQEDKQEEKQGNR
jgi:hypothetical protein